MWLEQDRREFDCMPQATKMPGYWLNEGGLPFWRIRADHAAGRFLPGVLRQCAGQLRPAPADQRGMGNTVLGHESELREFIRAYRALPAESFACSRRQTIRSACVSASGRTGCISTWSTAKFYPVTAALSFAAGGKFKLVDLAAGEEQQVNPGPRGKRP